MAEGRGGIESQGFAPLSELDDVETSFTPFHLRHKRLGVPDFFGERRLREAGFVAQLHEQVEEGTVMPMVS